MKALDLKLIGLALVLALGVLPYQVGCPLAVIFPDKALESAVRAEIGKPFGMLTQADLIQVRSLDGRSLNIRDLSGIEYCTNLEWLDLDTNLISDITPLEQLGRPENPFDSPLYYLNLDSNQVTYIGPLAGLLNLRGVSLFANQIADLGPLVTNAQNGGLGAGDYIILDQSTMNDEALNVDIPLLTSYNINIILGENPGTSDTSGESSGDGTETDTGTGDGS